MPELAIKDVSLISTGPARGHVEKETKKPVFVDPTTLDQLMASLAGVESIRLREDHTTTVGNTIGYVKNFRRLPNKILGDMYFYENAENAPLFVEMAGKNPDHLGLSLEFGGEDEEAADMVLARCFAGEQGVRAVALVSIPAANKSLFSALQPQDNLLPATTMAETPVPAPKTSGVADDTLAGLTSQLAALTTKCSSLEQMYSALQSKFEAGAQPADQVKLSEDDAKKVAEYSAKETVKMLSAQFGNVWVPPAGAAQPAVKQEAEDPVKKFEAIVSDLSTKEFSGDKVRARAAAMTRFSADYAASRPVAPRK